MTYEALRSVPIAFTIPANTTRRRPVKLETDASPAPPATQRSASTIKAFLRPNRSPRQVIHAVAIVAACQTRRRQNSNFRAAPPQPEQIDAEYHTHQARGEGPQESRET